jgi:gamma-glutamylcysteine synthetase
VIRCRSASAPRRPPSSPASCTIEQALSEAESFARELDLDQLIAARPSLVQFGLATGIGHRPAQAHAERILEIAEGGLAWRARLKYAFGQSRQ